jgi:hypothetical protein
MKLLCVQATLVRIPALAYVTPCLSKEANVSGLLRLGISPLTC